MKCIQCNADSNLKDRTRNLGRCWKCKHPFAFEPTTMDAKLQFTDGFFAKALADISANDTLYFTPRQLLYLLEKRLGRKAVWAGPRFAIFLTSIVSVFILFYSGLAWIAIGLLSLIMLKVPDKLALWWSERLPKQPKKRVKGLTLTDNMVDTWLQQWQRFNPPPVRLLLPPPSTSASLAPAAAADVSDYSFDRVLVCDSVAIARLLIANNIHFEHNCAVLSISGYPQAIFETTMAMLRRNPDLQVIALHDCSPSGVALINKLRTSPDWYIDSSQVIFDLGMLPRQIATARGQAYIQVSADSAQDALVMPPEVSKQLTATELQWLEAGYFVDLESFTPKKLMQIVSYGIARLQNLGKDVDDNLILVGDGGGSGGGSFIYASDNFG
jgi:hypothetical protein